VCGGGGRQRRRRRAPARTPQTTKNKTQAPEKELPPFEQREQLQRCLALIDAANAEDPTKVPDEDGSMAPYRCALCFFVVVRCVCCVCVCGRRAGRAVLLA
jgi:hypothetical protein